MALRWFRRHNRSMSCHEVLEVVQTYVDGETSVEISQRVLIHLQDCVDCAREHRVYQRIKVTLGRQRPTPDAGVIAALQDFVEQLSRGDFQDQDSAPA